MVEYFPDQRPSAPDSEYAAQIMPYLLGELSPTEVERIEHAASQNKELAAEIDITRQLIGSSLALHADFFKNHLVSKNPTEVD